MAARFAPNAGFKQKQISNGNPAAVSLKHKSKLGTKSGEQPQA